MGNRHYYHACRSVGDHETAGGTVSDCCPAGDFDFRNLSGADAETVQNTVTQVIEQNMNGIDKMVYMSSTSDSAGNMSISLTFEADADPDIARVQVQNKLQLAMPLLPQEVQQQGITVQKSTSSFLLVAAFISDDKDMTQDDIADYVGSNVKDPLSRVTGVGKPSSSVPSTPCVSGSIPINW